MITYINPTITKWIDGKSLVNNVRYNATIPTFVSDMWNYFEQPLDMYSPDIPICRLDPSKGYIPYNPETTYLCTREKNISSDGKTWTLSNLWIEDSSTGEIKTILIPINGEIKSLYGYDDIWGDVDWEDKIKEYMKDNEEA